MYILKNWPKVPVISRKITRREFCILLIPVSVSDIENMHFNAKKRTCMFSCADLNAEQLSNLTLLLLLLLLLLFYYYY